MRHFLSVLIGFSVLLSTACSGTAGEAAPGGASTQPAATSRPASEIVLVRVGDSVITQEDFNREILSMPPDSWNRMKLEIMRGLVGQRLMILYLNDHPELVAPAALEAKIAAVLKAENVKTREELQAKLAAKGLPGKFELFIQRSRVALGREGIVRQVEKSANDDNYLREVFDKNPTHFNGTSMFVRYIRTTILPWDAPDKVQAKRNKMEKIRADLVAGRRTWEECVTESDCPTRITGGELGYVPRHMENPEAISKTAFELQPGQTSEVVSDRNAFYIIQVTKANMGNAKFEESKPAVKLWVQWEPLHNVEQIMLAKYPIVGVREPEFPPKPATRPAPQARRAPATRPATRPAGIPHRSTTRPAGMQNRATTRAANYRTTTRPANAVRPGNPPRSTTPPVVVPRPYDKPAPTRTNAPKAKPPATRPG